MTPETIVAKAASAEAVIPAQARSVEDIAAPKVDGYLAYAEAYALRLNAG